MSPQQRDLAPAYSRAAGRGMLHNPVLLVLLLAALAAALGLPFLSIAPNRLVTGTGLRLAQMLRAEHAALLLPLALLLAGPFLRPTPATRWAILIGAALTLAGLVWLAGDEAQRQLPHLRSVARISLGGGFWVLALLAGLAAADGLHNLHLGLGLRALAAVAVCVPVLGLVVLGKLDALALLREYASRQDVFAAAWQRHLQIVLASLVPALLAGAALGVAAARHARFGSALYAVLNLAQTIPSIALFALLVAPLAWLGKVLPGWGLGGVGLLPAVIALTLYALLPVVHGTAAGLRQVPVGVVESARAMGLTRRQLFWWVEAPLALPVLLSGLRVAAVQVIGLAVVAALIGAGGLGAIVFQGLLGSALDLVLLGVIPVVLLALAVDAGLGLCAAALAARVR